MTAEASSRGRLLAQALRQRSWHAVLAAFAIQMLIMGTSVYSFGVFVKPLAEDFGSGRTAVAGAFMVYSAVAALAAPFIGALVARHRIRHIMLVGATITAVGFGLVATSTALWQIYLYFGVLVGLGNLLAGTLPCATLIVAWFDKDRGLALGISLFGASAGAPLFVTLATELVQRFDWRATALAFSGILLFVLPILVTLLVREPDEPAPKKPPPRIPKAAGDVGFVASTLRDSRLWLVVGVLGFGAAPSIAVIQTLHSHVTDLGFAATLAAAVVAGMTIVGACAKPIFGRLADRWSLRGAVALTLLLQAAALCLIASTSHLGLLALAVVLYGLGYGGLAPLISLVLSTVFGAPRFPQVMGLMTTVLLPFTLVGFPFASWVQDQTSSYDGAYLSFVGFLALALAALSRLPLRAVEPVEAPLAEGRT